MYLPSKFWNIFVLKLRTNNADTLYALWTRALGELLTIWKLWVQLISFYWIAVCVDNELTANKVMAKICNGFCHYQGFQLIRVVPRFHRGSSFAEYSKTWGLSSQKNCTISIGTSISVQLNRIGFDLFQLSDSSMTRWKSIQRFHYLAETSHKFAKVRAKPIICLTPVIV